MADRPNKPRSIGPSGRGTPRAVILCECGGETKVVNTRGVETGDVIRRERDCTVCCRRITTNESEGSQPGLLAFQAAITRLEGIVTRLKTGPRATRESARASKGTDG